MAGVTGRARNPATPAVHRAPSAATAIVSRVDTPRASMATIRTATSASGTRNLKALKTESATDKVRAGEPEAVKRRSLSSGRSLLLDALRTMSMT